MSRRNTISREFFATIAAVLVLGLSVMCAIQTALSAAHFISERKSSLTDVLNGATALSERFADEGSIVTKPLQGEDVLERAHSGFELFNTASGALPDHIREPRLHSAQLNVRHGCHLLSTSCRI